MDNLGMKDAEKLVLVGYSAGGVAVMQYNTYFKNLPFNNKNIDLKMVVDSSVFLNEKHIKSGKNYFEISAKNLVKIANNET